MPLDASSLANALASIADNPPSGSAAAGQAWADAVKSYAKGIVPPSTTLSAAASALAGALGSAFATSEAAPGMESAFASFALTLAGGMVGAGFTGVPPTGQVGFASQFAGPKPQSHSEAAADIASLIDTWVHTGKAVLIAPPKTPQPWA